jgi:hypothetical protein
MGREQSKNRQDKSGLGISTRAVKVKYRYNHRNSMNMEVD